jgi:hypothetical protein
MKKLLPWLFLALLIYQPALGADTKLADLTATTTPVSTDILYIVVNPGGTPLDRFVTGANLGKALTVVGKVTVTQPATAATLTIINNKTFTVNKTLTLDGTDGTTMTFPATSATIARIDAANTFTGIQTFATRIIAPDGTSSVTGITFASKPFDDFGLWATASQINTSAGSGNLFSVTTSGINITSANNISVRTDNGFSIYNNAATLEAKLNNDGSNILALSNGANANTFRVYGTTSGSKYLSISHDGTNPILGSSSGALKIDSTAVTPASSGTRFLCISTAGVVTSSASVCSGT